MSTTGAAIEPFTPLNFDALGSPVDMEFKLPGIDETFELHGDIRHTTRTSEGHTHLGIEFTRLTALDVRLLDLINRGLSLT